jgi:adenosylmethionine-8-amino-7-oxononanoate aminotransferase
MSKIIELDKKHVWHPFTQMQSAPEPLSIIRAKDSVLYAEDGKTYLDCNSSWWVSIHGHGNEYLQDAINQQFGEIDHVIFAGATHPKAVELATRICKILPSQFEKVFFSDNGSTAVEVALKMAFQFWDNKNIKKTRILALEGAYHGDTFGAMSISQRGVFNKAFEHFFFDVDFIDFPTQAKEKESLIQAENLFKSGEFAAVIVEPIVQGSAGMRMYRPDFLNQFVSLAKKHEVLVIFDEIMTGFGRTGKLFAMNYLQVEADIVCLSKGLTGGVFPLGLTVSTQTIFDAFLSEEKTKALLHGHSFTGNPLACAAACASLDLIEDAQFFDDIDRVSRKHTSFYQKIKNHAQLADIRQTGTILALEIKVETNGYFSSIRDEAYSFFLENGMLLRPLGNVIFLNPPYCTTDEQLDFMYEKMEAFLNSLVSKS